MQTAVMKQVMAMVLETTNFIRCFLVFDESPMLALKLSNYLFMSTSHSYMEDLSSDGKLA